jgi:hypothetical protein
MTIDYSNGKNPKQSAARNNSLANGKTIKTESSQTQTQQTKANPLTLPSQSKVLAYQAIAATKEDMAEIDRVMAQRKTITLQYFDQAMAQCNQDIEAEITDRLGEDAGLAAFLQQELTLEGLEEQFQALLKPKVKTAAPEPETAAAEQTIETAATPVLEATPC